MAAKITYTIQKELGDLSIAPNGWKKQLTYTSWNNRKRNLICVLGMKIIQL